MARFKGPDSGSQRVNIPGPWMWVWLDQSSIYKPRPGSAISWGVELLKYVLGVLERAFKELGSSTPQHPLKPTLTSCSGPKKMVQLTLKYQRICSRRREGFRQMSHQVHPSRPGDLLIALKHIRHRVQLSHPPLPQESSEFDASDIQVVETRRRSRILG